jgi:hypothetical protein
MSTKYVDETTALIREVESQELIPHAIRLLSEGEPVSVERLATASGLTAEEVETMLRD